MKIRTNVKSGIGVVGGNHNEKQMKSLTVKTGVKAGALNSNHNEKLASSNRRR